MEIIQGFIFSPRSWFNLSEWNTLRFMFRWLQELIWPSVFQLTTLQHCNDDTSLGWKKKHYPTCLAVVLRADAFRLLMRKLKVRSDDTKVQPVVGFSPEFTFTETSFLLETDFLCHSYSWVFFHTKHLLFIKTTVSDADLQHVCSLKPTESHVRSQE